MHMFIAIPTIGRFTQQDTHWTNANRIYGDSPQKTNEREDRLGIQTYAYVPQIAAVMQNGNLYVYCMNDPILYQDESGQSIILASIIIGAVVGAAIGGVSAAAISDSKLGYVDWKWVTVGAVGGGVLGGLAGWGVGNAITVVSTGVWAPTTQAASWIQSKVSTIATTSNQIGKVFENWFYDTYNVVYKQVRVDNYRLDAIYRNAIIELKNYDWNKYPNYTNLIKRFTAQAIKYSHYIGQTIAGQKIRCIEFIFSSKPPQPIYDALNALKKQFDIVIKWVNK